MSQHSQGTAPVLVFVPEVGVWTTGDAGLDERVYTVAASGGNLGDNVSELIAAHAGMVKDASNAVQLWNLF